MKKVLTIATALLISTHALADGRSAAQNLFANLNRSRQEIGENASSTFVAPTLVRGMYALSDAAGKFVGFTNEAGSLFGDSRGFIGLSAGGSKFVPLTPDQTADLRREVAANIDRDKLINCLAHQFVDQLIASHAASAGQRVNERVCRTQSGQCT